MRGPRSLSSSPRKRGPSCGLGPRFRGDDESRAKRHRQPMHLFRLGPSDSRAILKHRAEGADVGARKQAGRDIGIRGRELFRSRAVRHVDDQD